LPNRTLAAIRTDLIELAAAAAASTGIVRTALTLAIDRLLEQTLNAPAPASDTNGSAPEAVHAKLFADPALHAPPAPSPEMLDGIDPTA